MTPLGAPSGAGERAAFEAWVCGAFGLSEPPKRLPGDREYWEIGVRHAWLGWQAARALPREPGLRITEENHGRLTAAVREADLAFEGVGGGTKHYVRECLLPALDKAGLIVTLAAEAAPTREGGA